MTLGASHLAALIRHARDVIIVSDAAGEITFVSPAIEDTAGWRPEDLLGRDGLDLLHPDDLPTFLEHVEWLLEHPGRPHTTEARVRHRDGSWLWTEVVATNLLDDAAIGGLVGHFRDVTERKAVEQARREGDLRLRSLVRHAFDILTVVDRSGAPTYLAPSVCRVLGYDPDELLRQPLTPLVHPDDVEVLTAAFADAMTAPGRVATTKYRIRHADGTWRILEGVVTNLLDDPAVRGLVVNARDVTAAVEAQESLRASEERFTSVVQNSSDLVTIFDERFWPTYVSPSHETILGHPLESLRDEARPDLVHPDDLEPLLDALASTAATPGASTVGTFRWRHADGSWRHVETVVTNLLDNPAVRGIVLNARDVTDRVEAEEGLRRSEQRFQSLVRHSSDVVAVMDADGGLTYVSSAIESVLGVPAADLVAGEHALELHPDDAPAWVSAFAAVRDDPDRHLTLEVRFRSDGRPWRWIEVSFTNLLGDPAVEGIVTHARDVTDRRRAEDELAHQALHDELTSLPNRALLLDRLERSLARDRRTGLRTALLFCDLDRFKVVNDSLGHAAGDELLVAVTDRLRGHLRETDSVCRLGGDEFVVLLEDLPDDRTAVHVGEQILRTMRHPFRLAGRELFVTISIGVACSSTLDDTADSLMRDADAAMYEAKGKGRNRIERFDGAVRNRVLERLDLEHDLHRALERRELRLVYQPAFELASGTIVGVEALLRWHHPRRGVVMPAEFVGLAEETGLIVPIGEWVLDRACAQARAWQDLDPDGPLRTVWVNVSARQLDRPELVDRVRAALCQHGLEPRRLGLELTESALIEEVETTRSALAEIESIGVRLAIDDFGTGYSSLLYLQRYAVDVLKLDRSFVVGVGSDTDDAAIATAVIHLGHSLGMEVSAEGVETPRQLDALRRLGCDTACGFLLARPGPADEITRRLAASTGPTAAAGA